MSKKDKKHSEKEDTKQNSVNGIENQADQTNGSQQTVNNKDAASEEKTASKGAAQEEKNDPATEKTEALQKALDELNAKYTQLNDTYLRTLAEYDNYRKRSIREKADLIKSGGETVLVNVLSVVDDFERGLSAMDKAEDMNAVKEGMNLIYSKLQGFLKQNGIAVIETENKVFDTDLHEAITTIPAPDENMKGKIIDCVQKGYFLHDKVIRYAKVVVGN